MEDKHPELPSSPKTLLLYVPQVFEPRLQDSRADEMEKLKRMTRRERLLEPGYSVLRLDRNVDRGILWVMVGWGTSDAVV